MRPALSRRGRRVSTACRCRFNAPGLNWIVSIPALGVLLLTLGGSAPAQETEDLYSFYAEEATVVAAAKRPQRLSEAPASAYVLTRADLDASGYRTLGEALQSVPGLLVANDRNYTYLWVRGFGRPGDYNSRMLLLIDGHRVNENIYGSALVGHEFSLDLQAVERIEVVKGPGSALYGDSAFFAVINVITRAGDADGARASSGSATLAGYGTRAAFSSISLPPARGWSGYAAGSWRKMNGQDLFYPEFAGTHGGIAKDADGEESYTLYGSVSRPGWRLQANTSSRRKTIPTAPYGTRFDDPGTHTADARSFVELRHDRNLAGLDLQARGYCDWYRYRGDWVYDGTPPGPESVVNKDVAEGDWCGEEVRLQRSLFGTGNLLMLGQEIERNLRGWQLNYDVDPYLVYTDDNRRSWRWAAFAQQELRPHSRLNLTLGLRLDRYESFGSTLNPRLAAVLLLPRANSLKLLYGSAFRAPNVFELFYSVPGEIPRSDLRTEKVNSFEVSWETHAFRSATLGVSCFENDLHELISQVSLPDGSLSYENREKVRSRGLELTSTWRWGVRVSGRAGYLYQSSFEEGAGHDRLLSNSPHHSGSVGLAYRLPWLRMQVTSETMFVSELRSTHGTGVPPAAVSSLHLNLQPRENGLTLRASVYNLTDAHWSVSGSGELTQDAIRQDGRSFALTLGYRFRDGTAARQ